MISSFLHQYTIVLVKSHKSKVLSMTESRVKFKTSSTKSMKVLNSEFWIY